MTDDLVGAHVRVLRVLAWQVERRAELLEREMKTGYRALALLIKARELRQQVLLFELQLREEDDGR